MPSKNISGKNLNEAITSDDVLGKDVIDSAGHIVGVAEKLFLDPNNFDVVGIGVDKGFLRTGLVIGKDYLDKVTPFAVFLKTRIAYEMRGMNVFDKYGVLLGKVKDVALKEEKNVLKYISVSLTGGISTTSCDVPAGYISSIGYHIFLKISKAELLELLDSEANKEKKK
jgi:sporulation protein YlmC with PRC-barrel domain